MFGNTFNYIPFFYYFCFNIEIFQYTYYLKKICRLTRNFENRIFSGFTNKKKYI